MFCAPHLTLAGNRCDTDCFTKLGLPVGTVMQVCLSDLTASIQLYDFGKWECLVLPEESTNCVWDIIPIRYTHTHICHSGARKSSTSSQPANPAGGHGVCSVYHVVMAGKVKRVVLGEEVVVGVVSVRRGVLVGAVPVVGKDRHWAGVEPARTLPPITLLEHTACRLQLLQNEMHMSYPHTAPRDTARHKTLLNFPPVTLCATLTLVSSHI